MTSEWERRQDDNYNAIHDAETGRCLFNVYDATSADIAQALAAPDLARELRHLVRLLEPKEREGGLDVPGLATLNGARAALMKAGVL